ARRRLIPKPDGWCEIDGHVLKNFASNDYLGLALDSRLVDAACRAAKEGGIGAGASPLVSGRTQWHADLEERIAQFECAEACVLFPSGYAANLGILTSLVQPGDQVFSDRWNHASLIDGCRLSGADVYVYQHGDVQHLESLLAKTTHSGHRLIVTDSVFSVDGDVAPLAEICRLAETYDTMLVVDEAHATGIYGEHGRGLVEALHLESRVMLRIATLSKAVGAQGGFVVGDQALIDWLWNRARSQVFSTAMSPAVCAAACTALDIIEAEPWRRERLWELSRVFVARLLEAELHLGSTAPQELGPIVPVMLDHPEIAMAAGRMIENDGFLVGTIRPPSVPVGTSRLRITMSCAHTEADVKRMADSVVECVRQAVATERHNDQ
ncbi:MAG: 8-amino-7-oxononanoate synthase, partial [Planctomycetaceae bacterium]